MVILGGEKGAALVTALMLTALALVISTALLYSVTTGTRLSASQKRYRSALAAAHGGIEVLTEELIPRMFQSDPLDPLHAQEQMQAQFTLIGLQLPQFGCLRQKLDTRTALWSACSEGQASADPGQSPDAIFRLGSDSSPEGYRVSAKIVDTVPGNSDQSGVDYLDLGGSVAATDQIIHPRHVPAIYNLSVQGVREGASAPEKARLSVLYAY